MPRQIVNPHNPTGKKSMHAAARVVGIGPGQLNRVRIQMRRETANTITTGTGANQWRVTEQAEQILVYTDKLPEIEKRINEVLEKFVAEQR